MDKTADRPACLLYQGVVWVDGGDSTDALIGDGYSKVGIKGVGQCHRLG